MPVTINEVPQINMSTVEVAVPETTRTHRWDRIIPRNAKPNAKISGPASAPAERPAFTITKAPQSGQTTDDVSRMANHNTDMQTQSTPQSTT
jgi:hypothetical protein